MNRLTLHRASKDWIDDSIREMEELFAPAIRRSEAKTDTEEAVIVELRVEGEESGTDPVTKTTLSGVNPDKGTKVRHELRRSTDMPKVLVTEPDNNLARDYCHALRAYGFEVEAAESGLDCLEQLRAFRPDVLLLEPDLLWGDGQAVLSIIADDPDLCRIVVVLLSENAQSKCNGTSPVKVARKLEKPVSAARLVSALLSLTEKVDDDEFVANWTVVEWGIPLEPSCVEAIGKS